MSFLKFLAGLVSLILQAVSHITKGTSGNDVITGSDRNDKIFGRKGDDEIDGGAGNDRLVGGKGNDTLNGGDGDDRLHGGKGDDVLSGGDGNDLIRAHKGNDTVHGGAGDDRMSGGSGNDRMNGGSGNDKLDGGKGDDTLDGGSGSDTVLGGSGNDTITYVASENAGANDVYEGGSGKDTLVLKLTRAEWLRADVQKDVSDFLKFIDDHTGKKGEADNKVFKFTAFGLKASEFENLKVVVDGVEIDPRDQAVDAVNDLFTSAAEDSIVTGNVLANDTVPDLVKSVALVSGPAVGSLTLNDDGTFAYDPGQAFNSLGAGQTATQTFTYRVTDADGDTDTATVTIKITGTNDGPVAVADTVATQEDQAIVITKASLLANDTDADAGDTLRIQAVGGAIGGAVALNAAGDVVFTPAADFSGTASFTYTAVDTAGAVSTALVTVLVSAVADAPAVSVQDVTGQSGQPVALDIAAALTDTDGSEVLSITLSGLPAGSLLSAGTSNPDGTFTLTPAQLAGLTVTPPAGHAGDIAVTVTATATEQSNGATAGATAGFVITLPVANRAPTDVALSNASVLENEKGAVIGTISATDPDAGDSHVFIVSDSRFEIVGGLLKLKNGIALDFEAAPSVSIDVTATDAGGLSYAKTFVIGVGDVPDVATSFADLLIGSSGPDVIDGLGGNDTIHGLGGDDTLLGGAGSDTLFGGDGNDLLDGGGGRNTLDGGAGDDTLVAGDGDNYVRDLAGTSVVFLGAGDNYVETGDDDDSVEVMFGNNTILTAGGNDYILASGGDNYVDSGDGDDVIDLGDGNNTVLAGSGNDDILLGNGDNLVYAGAGDDIVDAFDGNNLIYGEDGDDLIIVGEGDNTIYGGEGDDDIEFGDGANYVDGGDGDDIIYGYDGDYTILGGDGNDDISAFDGNSYVEGGDGDDFITFGDGSNTIYGGAGNDDIYAGDGGNFVDGGDGDDIIETGTGDDTLIGGRGADYLIGGGGNDVFIYRSAEESGVGQALRDVIEDFDAGGADRLDFSSFAVGVFSFLGDETAAFEASGNTQARFNDQTKILEVDADGDSQADMEVELSNTAGSALGNDDFITNT